MEENDNIDLRKYIAMARRRWWWYAIAFAVFITLAITYHFIHADSYDIHAGILVEEEDESGAASTQKMSGGLGSIMRSFSLGSISTSSVDNELLIFQTHSLMKRLVRELHLNRTYIERDGMKKQELYTKSPIVLACSDSLLDTLSIALKIKVQLLKDGTANINATKGLLGRSIGRSEGVTLPAKVSTPYGDFHILKTANYLAGQKRDITIALAGDDIIADGLMKNTVIDYWTKKSDGIYIESKAMCKQKGIDMLNGMMRIYNEIRLNRKNDRATLTYNFYNQQIAELTASLNESEKRVQDFQTQNDLLSPEMEASYQFGDNKANEKALLGLHNAMTAYDMILRVLDDPNRKYSLLPAAEGQGDLSAVTQYNQLIMSKNNLERSAHPDNVVLRQVIEQIDAMRSLVRENVVFVKQNTQMAINTATSEKNKSRSRLNMAPSYQRQYIDLMRDKEMKNSLYTFLLERRYTAALTLSSNLPQGFIIEPAYSDINPCMTKSLIAMAIAVLFSLLLPTIAVCIAANRKPKAPADSPAE